MDTGDFGRGSLTDIDGIRVDFDNGWGLIRPSNTSPVLSLRFEADTESALMDIQTLFQTELQKVDRSLAFL
jgi:phosphomannomutase/phosphoglucomutase